MRFVASMFLGILMGGIIFYFEPGNKPNGMKRKRRCRK